MVARFTSSEDLEIITSWINVVFSPRVTQHLVSGIDFWELVKVELLARNGNPNQRTMDFIGKTVRAIKKVGMMYITIVTKNYQNPPGGTTYEEMVS
ncbi:hypothetical protein MKX01_012642, partial [Papaver californicum]